MRKAQSDDKLALAPGKIYLWAAVKQEKKAPGRSLRKLIDQNHLVKIGPGLYFSPKKSRFGSVPVDDHSLVKAFLKSDEFLLFSTNLYNSLGLGLTQLRNENIVYNKKRYENIQLSGKNFCFKRPNNGFPKRTTPEFLLVDLVNNIKLIGESPSEIKESIIKNIRSGAYNVVELLICANKYGKIGTRKFFNEALSGNII